MNFGSLISCCLVINVTVTLKKGVETTWTHGMDQSEPEWQRMHSMELVCRLIVLMD